MKIAESIMQSIIFDSSHSYIKPTPEGITFEWLLQEAYTAERLQGKRWTVIFDHIKKSSVRKSIISHILLVLTCSFLCLTS